MTSLQSLYLYKIFEYYGPSLSVLQLFIIHSVLWDTLTFLTFQFTPYPSQKSDIFITGAKEKLRTFHGATPSQSNLLYLMPSILHFMAHAWQICMKCTSALAIDRAIALPHMLKCNVSKIKATENKIRSLFSW